MSLLRITARRNIPNLTAIKKRRFEYQDDYRAPNELTPSLQRVRQLQSIRILASEAALIGSNARYNSLQIQFQQLKSQLLNQMVSIQANREQGRAQLKIQAQSITTLGRWQNAETQFNKEIETAQNHLADSRQELARSEEDLKQAKLHKLNMDRRLAKLDELIKLLEEDG